MCPLSWLALLCLFSISALGHPNAVTGTAAGHRLRCHRRCSDLGLACQLPCTWEWYLEMLVWFWTCTSTDLALWNKAFTLKAQHTTEICDAELFKCQKFQNWSQECFCSCLGAELWSAMGLQSPRCSHWNCLCSLVGQRQPLICLTIDDYPLAIPGPCLPTWQVKFDSLTVLSNHVTICDVLKVSGTDREATDGCSPTRTWFAMRQWFKWEKEVTTRSSSQRFSV